MIKQSSIKYNNPSMYMYGMKTITMTISLIALLMIVPAQSFAAKSQIAALMPDDSTKVEKKIDTTKPTRINECVDNDHDGKCSIKPVKARPGYTCFDADYNYFCDWFIAPNNATVIDYELGDLWEVK